MARKTAQTYDFNSQHVDDNLRVVAEVEENKEAIVAALSNRILSKTVEKNLAAAGDYAANDVMSESASAGTSWIFTLEGIQSGWIEKVVAICSTTALTPRLTLQLYTEPPTCALNDNVANTGCIAADTDNYIGYVDLPAMRDLGTGQSEAIATPNSSSANLPLSFLAPKGRLYGIIVTRDAITDEAANMNLSLSLHIRED